MVTELWSSWFESSHVPGQKHIFPSGRGEQGSNYGLSTEHLAVTQRCHSWWAWQKKACGHRFPTV